MDFRPFKIGKYLLLERLATGGMAEVYRAKASGAGGFEKQLAIKRILPNYSQNEEFRRMFEYEARLSSMLTHANIVQIYDFVKSGDTYLLAMEYVHGKNLRQFVNKARKLGFFPPISFSVYVINEVCKGLEYAHRKKDELTGKTLNIIHRDMSPQNIMLSYEGAIKIVDFGIAKAKDRVDETRSGVIKGKFGYMSPEQANGQSIDHRSDIFSSGIILWEMLTGRRLFTADNDMATLKMIQECVIPSPERINPKVTQDLEKIILKALTKDLKLRFQSAGDFHRQLQGFLNKHYPTFTQKDVSDIYQRTFAAEIEKEKKRFEQIHRQSIPFSQGASTKAKEEDGELDDVFEEEITRSDHQAESSVTFVDELELDHSQVEASIIEDPEDDSGIVRNESQFHLEKEPTNKGSLQTLKELEYSKSIASEKTVVESPLSLSELGDDTNHNDDPIHQTASKTQRNETTLKGKSKTIPIPHTAEHSRSHSRTVPIERGAGTSASQKTELATQGHGSDPKVELPTQHTFTYSSKRRDGAISGEDLSRAAPSNITLEPAVVPPARPEEALSQQQDWESYYQPEGKSLFGKTITLFLFVCLVGGTAYLYRVYLAGSMETWIGGSQNAAPAEFEGATAESEQGETGRAVAGGCSLQVVSDPPGATVIVDGQQLGTTSPSLTIATSCDRKVNLVLRKSGYEPLTQDVLLEKEGQEFFQSLKPIPTGRLELILNRNATVEVDGRVIQQAAANKLFSVSLVAGRKYNFRFVNEVLGIDIKRSFSVDKAAVLRESINLDP